MTDLNIQETLRKALATGLFDMISDSKIQEDDINDLFAPMPGETLTEKLFSSIIGLRIPKDSKLEAIRIEAAEWEKEYFEEDREEGPFLFDPLDVEDVEVTFEDEIEEHVSTGVELKADLDEMLEWSEKQKLAAAGADLQADMEEMNDWSEGDEDLEEEAIKPEDGPEVIVEAEAEADEK